MSTITSKIVGHESPPGQLFVIVFRVTSFVFN